MVDHLGEVRLHHEAQGPVGPLIEEGGFLAETPYGIADEAQLHARRQDGIAQLVFRGAFQAVVEGQGVEKDAPGHRGRIGGQARIEFAIQLFREGGRILRRGRDIGLERRYEGLLAELGDDLLPDGAEGKVDMVQVDRIGLRRLPLPQTADGPRQQAQHAAHPLEVPQRRGLFLQGRYHLGMQGKALIELFPVLLFQTE